MSERDEARLREWQRRLSAAEAAYGDELVKMDGREKVYAGEQERIPLFRTDGGRDVPHLRNVCCEMVENQIDSTIPRPKVTARKKENEDKARLIENMLRNKLDLLPFERIEEAYHDHKNTNERRFHNLKYIEKVATVGGRTAGQSLPGVSTNDDIATTYTVADILSFVKTYDKDFTAAHDVSPELLNEDGTPKVFYHGTGANFTVFKSENGTYWFSERLCGSHGGGARREERQSRGVLS